MKRTSTNERKELIMAIEKIKQLLGQDDGSCDKLTRELKRVERRFLDEFYRISRSQKKTKRKKAQNQQLTNDSN